MNPKILFGALVAISLLSLFNISLAANFERDLSYGLTNDSDVRELQEFLKGAGYFKGEATGNFYDLTCAALREFQKTNSINPTCNFGPLTRAAVQKQLSANSASQIILLSPRAGDSWEYDKKYPIEYTSQGVTRLGFEVRNGKTVVYRTEAPIPAGSGIGFNLNPDYRVKIGTGNNFSVKLFDWDNPRVYGNSKGDLSVGTPESATIANGPAPTDQAKPAPEQSKTSNVAELSAAVQGLLESIKSQIDALRQLRGL